MSSRPSERSATFYELVYEFVRRVPEGRVVTYGQVALELGAPAAARAAGYALHYLSIAPPTDVPWWRVVNARGEISLKGRGSGADEQRQRLEDEGVRFDEDGRIDLSRYRWWPDN